MCRCMAAEAAAKAMLRHLNNVERNARKEEM